jgi:hypothetical protein
MQQYPPAPLSLRISDNLFHAIAKINTIAAMSALPLRPVFAVALRSALHSAPERFSVRRHYCFLHISEH